MFGDVQSIQSPYLLLQGIDVKEFSLPKMIVSDNVLVMHLDNKSFTILNRDHNPTLCKVQAVPIIERMVNSFKRNFSFASS